MVHTELGIALALIGGTGAGVLSLLSWEVFRQSPFGKAVFALTVMMSAFVIYYTVVSAIQTDLLVVEILQSLIYTVLVVVIALMIDAQRRIRTDTSGDT